MNHDCDVLEPLLFAFTEGEVSEAERLEIDEHLCGCARCSERVEEERRLTTALRADRTLSLRPTRRPRRRWGTLGALGVGCVATLVAVFMFMEPSAYGSITRKNLDPNLDVSQQERDLGRSNHVALPAGSAASIEIDGVCSINATGPVTFELDKVDQGWKLTLIKGQIQVTREQPASKVTMVVVNAAGRHVLDRGNHVFDAVAKVDQPPSLQAARLMQLGFEAFYEADDMKLAAKFLQEAADHPEAGQTLRAQALFYLAAAQSNAENHKEALKTAKLWRLTSNEPECEVINSITAAANWELGQRKEAVALWERMLRLNPKTPFRPFVEAHLARARNLEAEGSPKARPRSGPQRPQTLEPLPGAQGKWKAGDVIWSFDLKAPCYGSATAADIDGDQDLKIAFGTYYNDEHLYVLNAKTGKLAWRKKSKGGPLDASVLIHDVNGDGRLELVWGDSAYGRIYCADSKGKLLWTYDGPSGTDSPPAAADLDGDGRIEIVYGTMKVRGKEGRVVVLDGKKGTEKWSVKVPGHVQSEPALVDLNGDGVLDILVTNWMGDGYLRALSGVKGKELWRFETSDWIYHGVSVADFDRDQKPEIVVADRKGKVWLLEGESGKKVWHTKVKGESDGMVFGPTTLVEARGDKVPEIVVCGTHVHLLNAKNGKEIWTKRFQGRSIARGVAVGDLDGDGKEDLVFGQGKSLRVLRASDGKELWAAELKVGDHVWEHVDNAPLIDDFDGDGFLDVFIITGKGTSDESRPKNYGRAYLLRGGRGKSQGHRPWRTFRGSARRLGRR
ncbi:MAG: FG-GAP-like repeat-containing protein [Planctomycetota bacterium]